MKKESFILSLMLLVCTLQLTADSNNNRVTIEYENRRVTYTDISLNNRTNVNVDVFPGQEVSLSFDWKVAPTGRNGYCPGCIIQVYVGMAGSFSECIVSRVFRTPTFPNASGKSAVSFQAPTELGTYYITQAASLKKKCSPSPSRHGTSNVIAVINVVPFNVMPLSDDIILNPITLGWSERRLRYSNVSLNDTGKNYYSTRPGQQVALSFDLSVNPSGRDGYCPGCIVQFYVGIKDVFSECIVNKVLRTPSFVGHSTKNVITFTAPSEYGTYYITQHRTLKKDCHPSPSSHSRNRGAAIAVINVVPQAQGLDQARGSMITWNDKIYFFKDDAYTRYTRGNSNPDAGYPKWTSWNQEWNFPSPFNSGIDAAVTWNNGKVYFFKDNQYIRYTIGSYSPDAGYPKSINNWNFPSSFNSGIDASMVWNNEKAYFFKDDQYIRYTLGNSSPDPNYPQPISKWNSSTDRDIKFLATGDPQLNNNPYRLVQREGAKSAPKSVRTMKHIMSNELNSSQKGLIIAGDLTQNARNQEFRWYEKLIAGKEKFVYDGLGNHDYNESSGFLELNWNATDAIQQYVCCRDRDTPTTHSTENFNYSWDWNNVHFVQLNLYPCDDNDSRARDLRDHDCNESLTWLKNDLSSKVGGSNRPVVLIHHYGFDDLSTQESNNFDDEWWTRQERKNYWSAIADYNVIGILTGHIHTGAASFHKRWDRPDGLTSGPKYFNSFITGGSVGGSYYLKLNISQDFISVIQMYDKERHTAATNVSATGQVGTGNFVEKDRRVVPIIR